MRLITWNVNSVRQRLGQLLACLKECQPDVVCLQELKCVEEAFPHQEIEEAGYNILVKGQKTFNGVAILSKYPLEEVCRTFPEDPAPEQARYLEAIVTTGPGAHIFRIASLYAPNGNPVGSDKYTYKLAFMEALCAHATYLLSLEEPFILAGDYNIIPEARDARFPQAWREDALFLPRSRAIYRRLLHLGLRDALRTIIDTPDLYTFWDYQAGAFAKDAGIRIDHLLLSPQAMDLYVSGGVIRHMRGLEKPSDHAPVWGEFETAYADLLRGEKHL